MQIFKLFLSIIALINADQTCNLEKYDPSNNCVQFSVTSGTGCAWMCNYCANQLGTNNYYFTDNVCSYQQGQGCVGNPISGKSYTCCSVAEL
jgi:hypothetical protein